MHSLISYVSSASQTIQHSSSYTQHHQYTSIILPSSTPACCTPEPTINPHFVCYRTPTMVIMTEDMMSPVTYSREDIRVCHHVGTWACVVLAVTSCHPHLCPDVNPSHPCHPSDCEVQCLAQWGTAWETRLDSVAALATMVCSADVPHRAVQICRVLVWAECMKILAETHLMIEGTYCKTLGTPQDSFL